MKWHRRLNPEHGTRDSELADTMSDKDNIKVYVNGRPVKIYTGMQVKHALIASDESLYSQAVAGDIEIMDGDGFPIGMEGALREGSEIRTRRKK